MASGAVSSALAAGALVHASISAYHAQFETKVTISIASELQLFAQAFQFDQGADGAGDAAPLVSAVPVAAPRILKHAHHRPRGHIAALSGVSKKYVGISIAPKAERDVEGGEGLDTMALAALFRPRANIAKADAVPTRYVSIHMPTSPSEQPESLPPIAMAEAFKVATHASAPALSAALKSQDQKPIIETAQQTKTEYPTAPPVDGEGFEDEGSLPNLIRAAQGLPGVIEKTSSPPTTVRVSEITETDDHVRVVALPGQLRRHAPKKHDAQSEITQMSSHKDASVYYSTAEAARQRAEQTESGVDTQDAKVIALNDSVPPSVSASSLASTPAGPSMSAASGSVGPIIISANQAPVAPRPPSTPAPIPQVAPRIAPAIVPPAPPTPPANQVLPPVKKVALESAGNPGASNPSILALDGGTAAPAPTVQRKLSAPAAPVVVPMFSGHIYEAFTGAAQSLAGVHLQVLGTQLSAQTDENGAFQFTGFTVSGVLPVVITKDGYLKRRVDLKPGVPAAVELVSETALAGTALAAGDSHAINGAMIFGELVNADKSAAEGLTVELAGPRPAQIVYVDTNGAPNRDLKTTTSKGQFLALDLVPGTYLVSISDSLGREKAPHLIYVGDHEGIVRKFSTGTQVFISGHVVNASSFNAPVSGAKIQLLGSSQTVTTARDGRFVLGPLNVDCASQNYLHIEKAGFYRNRVDYACGSGAMEHAFYAFPASYLDAVASDAQVQLKPNDGAVLGHASFGHPVRMQLWGPEEINPEGATRGSDFYFDHDGLINPELDHTVRSGNFAILNAPDGISYIQAFDKDGRTLSFWPIYTSASTVNSYVQ